MAALLIDCVCSGGNCGMLTGPPPPKTGDPPGFTACLIWLIEPIAPAIVEAALTAPRNKPPMLLRIDISDREPGH